MPRIVVVTGASGGIGRASRRRVRRPRGHRRAGRPRRERARRRRRARSSRPADARIVMPADVADPDQVFAVAEKVEAEIGPIDVWVNVAFTSVFAPFDQITPEEYRRVTEVSYLGYVYGTMAALKYMKPRDRGTIVQVGSALAYRGIPLQTAYCGAKHAIQGFHEALRCELLHDKSNVHVTMVQMPAVNTPQFSWVLSRLPASRPAGAADLPARVRRPRRAVRRRPSRSAASTGSGPRTMGTLAANAIAPGLLDRYLGRTGFKSQQTEQRQRPGRAGEPVGAGRRRRRPRLRRPRRLRRQVPRARPAAVGLPPSRPARRCLGRRCRGRGRARSSGAGGDHARPAAPRPGCSPAAHLGAGRGAARSATERCCAASPATAASRRPWIVRVLGARLLVQAVAEAVRPTPRRLRLGRRSST